MNLTSVQGITVKKGSKLYFQTENKFYLIHFTDVERLKLQPQQNVEGILFHMKEPVVEHGIMVHGWVYPGVVKLCNQLPQKSTNQ